MHDQTAGKSETVSQDSSNSRRTDIGDESTRVSSTKSDRSLEENPESSKGCATTIDIATNQKSIPEHMLKREESTNKFNLMDLLTARPLDASSNVHPSTSRKRLCPDTDHDIMNDSSPKKSNPRGLDKQGYRSGTTAVVGILRDNDFVVANAGDSKCVLASKGT